jgi:hypothetical protein
MFSQLKSLITQLFQNVLTLVTWSFSTTCDRKTPKHSRTELMSNWIYAIQSKIGDREIISPLTDVSLPVAELIERRKNLYFTERKGNWIVILYVQFITLFLTLRLFLELLSCLFVSRIQAEILCLSFFSSAFLLSHLFHWIVCLWHLVKQDRFRAALQTISYQRRVARVERELNYPNSRPGDWNFTGTHTA